MEIIHTPNEFINYRKNDKATLGFVPTMGALHEGHKSLIDISKKECEKTVVSIFVNPTQFNKKEDFDKYPNTLENDVKLLKEWGVDLLFYPQYEDLYPDNYAYSIHENTVSGVLEGEFRPGHFNGVLVVVLKLLQITKPNKIYLGEKDYQQYLLIKGMQEAFFLDTEVVPCPTAREKTGLALSSRNFRLTDEEKLRSAAIYKELCDKATSIEQKKANLTALGFDVEYIEEKYQRLFIACNVNNVRLIDNVPL